MKSATYSSVTACLNGREQPASLVVVQVSGTNASVLSDEDGAFQLTEIPAPEAGISEADSAASRFMVFPQGFVGGDGSENRNRCNARARGFRGRLLPCE